MFVDYQKITTPQPSNATTRYEILSEKFLQFKIGTRFLVEKSFTNGKQHTYRSETNSNLLSKRLFFF